MASLLHSALFRVVSDKLNELTPYIVALATIFWLEESAQHFYNVRASVRCVLPEGHKRLR